MLKIIPIGKFQYDCAVLRGEIAGQVIFSIYQEDVGNRGKPPLETGIDIEVVGLFVILDEGIEEYIVREGDIQLRADQPEIGGFIGKVLADFVIGKI